MSGPELYQLCDEDLGDAILKGYAEVANLSEQELLSMIKQLAVTTVLVVVRRSDFLNTRNKLIDKTRLFTARLKGKTSICSYNLYLSKRWLQSQTYNSNGCNGD